MTKRKTPPVPAPKPVEIMARVVRGSSVSLSRVASVDPALDDLDPRGVWGRGAVRTGSYSVTAQLLGDPSPTCSALAQRYGARS